MSALLGVGSSGLVRKSLDEVGLIRVLDTIWRVMFDSPTARLAFISHRAHIGMLRTPSLEQAIPGVRNP